VYFSNTRSKVLIWVDQIDQSGFKESDEAYKNQWSKLLDDVEKQFVDCHALRPAGRGGNPGQSAAGSAPNRASGVVLDGPETHGALKDLSKTIASKEFPFTSIDMSQVSLCFEMFDLNFTAVFFVGLEL